jgi:hypothetical protein
MALTAEFFAMIGREGGTQRAKVLSGKQRRRSAENAANARWAGLTAEERKIERAKGRAPKFETEPPAKRKAANA